MIVVWRIIDIFMAIGALPAILIVAPLEELFDIEIAGTWFSGALAFCFGVLISLVFAFGLYKLLT